MWVQSDRIGRGDCEIPLRGGCCHVPPSDLHITPHIPADHDHRTLNVSAYLYMNNWTLVHFSQAVLRYGMAGEFG